MLEISFEDLFAGGSILEDHSGPSLIDSDEAPVVGKPSKEIQSTGEPADEEASFFAVDDILRQELDGNFSSSITTIDDDGETAVPHDDHAGATPSEMDLPYVDVHEILQQDGATSGVQLVDEPTAENETSASNARENGKSREARTDSERHEPPAAPERKRDGVNGLAASRRRVDEREHLLIAGLRHYKNQRFEEAIAEFENAIRLYPDFKEAYSILGNAYFRNRMFDAAAKAYTRVKEMDPYDTTAYENMGVIYANRGDFLDAMKEWQRVLEIDPNRDDIRRKIERASRMVTRKAVA
jgi:tetratricopeptide (TPR) repeat protein